MHDTIYAPATPTGGAIAILRVSGAASLDAVRALTRKHAFEPGHVMHARVYVRNRALDDCLAVYFAAPRSFTGEDMAELHLHGSYAIMYAVMDALREMGLRLAGPGEFTKRAFLSGKMDLAQAESVMLSIRAQSEAAASAAQSQMRGALHSLLAPVRESLLKNIAHLEATIDYPDEMEDDPFSPQPWLSDTLLTLQTLKNTQEQGRMLFGGYTVAIVGQPNAGKSSLLNALVRDERAIVTEHAGTTRDVLEAGLVIHGIPVRLFDTAGIRESRDEIEIIGVDKARGVMREADMRILVIDGSRPLDDGGRALLAEKMGVRKLALAKADLLLATDPEALEKQLGEKVFAISSKTGAGLDVLLDALAQDLPQTQGLEQALLHSARQANALERAMASLQDATAHDAAAADLLAIDLRDALNALGELTGETADEQVIDEIFASFCVGK